MTEHELAIVMYLEGCKTRAQFENDDKTVELLSEILKQIEYIVNPQPVKNRDKSGDCQICGTHTEKLLQKKYCRLCFDQFID